MINTNNTIHETPKRTCFEEQNQKKANLGIQFVIKANYQENKKYELKEVKGNHIITKM